MRILGIAGTTGAMVIISMKGKLHVWRLDQLQSFLGDLAIRRWRGSGDLGVVLPTVASQQYRGDPKAVFLEGPQVWMPPTCTRDGLQWSSDGRFMLIS